ncbi:NAD(P)/FAD-dependent oxidoreductase [Lachnoclostridium sp. Marseille-P6806]|uniref:NAD(P)/FAD-dependent oxidoreductase n=1 Tax=Lachnoclostridium sp. Marseille-P6806 TaxID=2364793 RepID=UPI001030F3CA|nr:NAD(P)/FAD-dependent oxidoreductase [Lachnoclostridium sp. Marseille-P6806]
MYDVIIIGAGVTGCAVARELARRERSVAVLERGLDVCEGTSKANSGIVHAGHDAHPGTWKARFNVEGSLLMEELSKELDFPYRRNTSLVIGFDEEDRRTLEGLLAQGLENGVKGLELWDGSRVREKEPQLSDAVTCALYCPTGGIVDPFLLTVALAENACVGGVSFFFGEEVTELCRAGEGFVLKTARGGSYETRAVVNAAGVYADVFHNMVSEDKVHITPRKGEYLLMDKKTTGFVNATIFQCPTKMGKGILVTPTVHGNLLLGPTSEDIADKENTETTAAGLEEVLAKAGLSAKELPVRQVITSFTGLRAHSDNGDFIVGEAADCPGFFDAAGIESPGLTSAPAIGRYLAERINERFPAPEKTDFIAVRKGIPCMADADPEERKRLVAENPLYANVVCRCELVTEGEIVEAIRRPVGAKTLDGIKRRVRAGMGRCQAGFCTPKQMEILARELGVEEEAIVKSGPGARLLTGYTKSNIS